MKRDLLVLACVAAGMVGAAQAQEACEQGVDNAITLVSWSAKEGPGNFAPTVVNLELRNALSKGIRMLDASVFYRDALGRDIGNYPLAADAEAAAGGEFTQQGTYFSDTRLLKALPADIMATICTRAVIYDDGTTEAFG